MRLDDRVYAIRAEAVRRGIPAVAQQHKGVSKERIQRVLSALSLDHPDIADAVFALLDDTRASWFSSPPPGALFCDGATTAHVACHVGILQRGLTKLDREGRDYWLKPLRDIGAIEICFLAAEQRTFLAGHPISKSPNNCYRLDSDFIKLLQSHDDVFDVWLEDWSNGSSTRKRLQLQASVAVDTATRVRSGHAELILACTATYVPRFLPDYEVIFTDANDGDRITSDERVALAVAGLSLGLADPMPDTILWNPQTDGVWIIEAVTSDGEVDLQKLSAVRAWAARHGKPIVGATTAYLTWKAAAARQARHKNLAPKSYLWILEDPGRHFLVCEASDYPRKKLL